MAVEAYEEALVEETAPLSVEAEEVLPTPVSEAEVSTETVPEEADPVVETPPSSVTQEIIPERTPSRNLSAPRRLKIVGQSTPPSRTPPPQRSATAAAGAKPAVPVKDAATAEPVTEAEKLAAAKKKAAGVHKNWEAPKVTKRDLLGMTEEVEISTRSFGRRPKKQAPRTNNKNQITTPGAKKRIIKIDGDITVADLADRMGIKAADIVRKLIKMGMMVNAHQTIDLDTATLIAGDYEYEIQNVEVTAESFLLSEDSEGRSEDLEDRAPIVTIMGHVDHGKTSLLDRIRSTRVAAGEAGGITQHIGAYQVEKSGKKITFLDTPGHEAFTKMRARGAAVTDISILVVAADEGPKPQTIEALAHARDAKTPIIVAITKIDKPEANPDKVIQSLSAYELVPEEWGGDTMFCKVSAMTGEGMDDLFERILLQAEVMELKANPQRSAKAIVIESRLDKGKGPVATIVIIDGSLEQGQPVVSGMSFGKIRAIFDDTGKMIKKAGPATPVEILGLNEVPEAGDTLIGVADEGVARKAADLLLSKKKHDDLRKASRISLEEMYSKMKAGEMSELRVVLKGDVQGSVEAVADALAKITHDEVKVNVIFKAVGGISESDVSLAAASGALVLGFNVRPTNQAKSAAAQEGVQLKSYSIIYELIDDVKLGMQGLLSPDIKEQVLGQAEVRDVFTLSKFGTVAGCYVTSGKILRNGFARLIRDSVVVY
jgi:translation initiation factor IF-2